MNTPTYQLTLNKDTDCACLILTNKHHEIRKWHGVFAELIFDKIQETSKQFIGNVKNISLNKKQVHSLFTETTCLHQMVLYHLNINKDLLKKEYPIKYRHFAESLLLQIRINIIHQSYENLQSYFVNEFTNNDISSFDKTLNILIGKKLIQSIMTEDGQQFFDKNTQPHDHIYFKKHKKLVDCSKEIADFFSLTQYFTKSQQTYANIFYVNKKLSKRFC